MTEYEVDAAMAVDAEEEDATVAFEFAAFSGDVENDENAADVENTPAPLPSALGLKKKARRVEVKSAAKGNGRAGRRKTLAPVQAGDRRASMAAGGGLLGAFFDSEEERRQQQQEEDEGEEHLEEQRVVEERGGVEEEPQGWAMDVEEEVQGQGQGQGGGADDEVVQPEEVTGPAAEAAPVHVAPAAVSAVSAATTAAVEPPRQPLLRYMANDQVRVHLILNGDGASGKRAAVLQMGRLASESSRGIEPLLDVAQAQLRLTERTKCAKRLYSAEGEPVLGLDDIVGEMTLVVSCGEKFDPRTGRRERKEPAARKAPAAPMTAAPATHAAARPSTATGGGLASGLNPIKVQCFVNGEPVRQKAKTVCIPAKFFEMSQVLDFLQEDLHLDALAKCAKRLYDRETGEEVTTLADLRAGMDLVVAGSERFDGSTGTQSEWRPINTPKKKRNIANLLAHSASVLGKIAGGRFRQINQRRVAVFVNGDRANRTGRRVVIPPTFENSARGVRTLLDHLQEQLKLDKERKAAQRIVFLGGDNDGAELADLAQAVDGSRLAVVCNNERFDPLTGQGRQTAGAAQFQQRRERPATAGPALGRGALFDIAGPVSQGSGANPPAFMNAGFGKVELSIRGDAKGAKRMVVLPGRLVSHEHLFNVLQDEIQTRNFWRHMPAENKVIKRILFADSGAEVSDVAELTDGARLEVECFVRHGMNVGMA